MVFDYFNDGRPEIIFQNVKDLFIKGRADQRPDLLVFPQLTRLKLDCFPDFSIGWIDYILRQTNLTNLDIVNGVLDDRHLSRLVNGLPNLVEFSVVVSTKLLLILLNHGKTFKSYGWKVFHRSSSLQ